VVPRSTTNKPPRPTPHQYTNCIHYVRYGGLCWLFTPLEDQIPYFYEDGCVWARTQILPWRLLLNFISRPVARSHVCIDSSLSGPLPSYSLPYTPSFDFLVPTNWFRVLVYIVFLIIPIVGTPHRGSSISLAILIQLLCYSDEVFYHLKIQSSWCLI